MARSMNGINNIEVNNIEFPDGSTISSASNLVQLDTNNNFTGNTSYENNLPTSNVNPLVVDIGNNTMLNKFSADKLYIGNAEISECFNGASITDRDLTLTRVDGENPEVIGIPETSLSTCVLLTGIQEIDGTKTFVDFPEIKLTNAAVPDPTANNQFATKKYVDDNGGGSGDAELDGGTEALPQTFTEFNKFNNTTEFKDILAKSTESAVSINIKMESASSNLFKQTSSNDSGGGVNNQITQSGGVGNTIIQESSLNGNSILQNGTNDLFDTKGSITATSSSSKIGIGESSPSATLETFTVYTGTQNTIPDRTENIPNNTTVRIYLAHQPSTTQSFKYGMIMGVTSLGRCYIQSLSNGNDAPRNLLLNPNPGNYGRVGIGINSSPTERLYVNGNVFVTGIYRRPSDDRLKKNEKLIVNATETLCKLKPQIYDKYHNMDLSGSSFIESGLIAQEIYYNAPELRHLIHLGINTDASGNESTPTPDEMDLSGVDIGSDPDYSSHGWSKENPSTVNLDGFIAYLIKSNQELHERILKLEDKIGV